MEKIKTFFRRSIKRYELIILLVILLVIYLKKFILIVGALERPTLLTV